LKEKRTPKWAGQVTFSGKQERDAKYLQYLLESDHIRIDTIVE
jgi:hypothetical protein